MQQAEAVVCSLRGQRAMPKRRSGAGMPREKDDHA
jgi:hypothetical protein